MLLGLGQLLGNLDKGLTHMIPSTCTGLGKEQIGLFGIRLTLLKGDLPLGLQIELVADQRNDNVGRRIAQKLRDPFFGPLKGILNNIEEVHWRLHGTRLVRS